MKSARRLVKDPDVRRFEMFVQVCCLVILESESRLHTSVSRTPSGRSPSGEISISQRLTNHPLGPAVTLASNTIFTMTCMPDDCLSSRVVFPKLFFLSPLAYVLRHIIYAD
jgi:hypothetical protein